MISGNRYSLYGILDDNSEKYIENLVKHINGKLPDEKPHFTIVYGPRMMTEKEETSKDFGIALYPVQNLNPKSIDLKFMGVGHFIRKDKIHIFLEFDSKTLTDIQVETRKLIPELQEDYRYYSKKAGDRSYDFPPKRWLHITISSIPNDEDSFKNLVYIEDKIRDYLSDNDFDFKVKNIAMVSAVSDTIIELL